MSWCQVNPPDHTQLSSWGAAVLPPLTLQHKMNGRARGHWAMRELETKKASGRLLRERRGPGGEARLCPPRGKGPRLLSAQPRGFAPPHSRALPPTKLQARVSHLLDAKAQGRERGKRWHGAGSEIGAEVGGGMERGGGLIAWQQFRGTCTGDIISGRLEHRPWSPRGGEGPPAELLGKRL